MKKYILLLLIGIVHFSIYAQPKERYSPVATNSPNKGTNEKVSIEYSIIQGINNTWGYDIYIEKSCSSTSRISPDCQVMKDLKQRLVPGKLPSR